MRPLPLLLAGVLVVAGCADDDTDGSTPDPVEDTGEVSPDGDEATDTDAADDGASDDPNAPADSEDADDGSTTGTDTTGDDSATGVEDLEFTTCDTEGLTVDYPTDWTAHEGDAVPDCRVFHPEPIDEYQNESLHYAVRLSFDAVPFEDATAEQPGEVSREQTTVDGHDAVIVERDSDGEALLPEGESSYTYIVDLDGSILVATTSTVGESDYDRDQRVLDRMMESVRVDVEVISSDAGL